MSLWVRRHRGLALGIAYAGSNLGGSLMSTLTVTVAARYGWREALLAVVPVALFVLLPASLFLVRDPRPAELDEAAQAAGEGSNAERHATASEDDKRAIDLRGALRTRSFWILTATLFTFFFYLTTVLDHFVLALIERRGSPRPKPRPTTGGRLDSAW